MLKIVARHKIRAEKRTYYLELMAELVQKTNQFDEGCIEYRLFEDRDQSEFITLIEEWESQETLNNHMAKEHFKKIVPLLDACYLDEEVNFYNAI